MSSTTRLIASNICLDNKILIRQLSNTFHSIHFHYSLDEEQLQFLQRASARIASDVLAIAIPSVCPSGRHTPVLCQNDGT